MASFPARRFRGFFSHGQRLTHHRPRRRQERPATLASERLEQRSMMAADCFEAAASPDCGAGVWSWQPEMPAVECLAWEPATMEAPAIDWMADVAAECPTPIWNEPEWTTPVEMPSGSEMPVEEWLCGAGLTVGDVGPRWWQEEMPAVECLAWEPATMEAPAIDWMADVAAECPTPIWNEPGGTTPVETSPVEMPPGGEMPAAGGVFVVMPSLDVPPAPDDPVVADGAGWPRPADAGVTSGTYARAAVVYSSGAAAANMTVQVERAAAVGSYRSAIAAADSRFSGSVAAAAEACGSAVGVAEATYRSSMAAAAASYEATVDEARQAASATLAAANDDYRAAVQAADEACQAAIDEPYAAYRARVAAAETRYCELLGATVARYVAATDAAYEAFLAACSPEYDRASGVEAAATRRHERLVFEADMTATSAAAERPEDAAEIARTHGRVVAGAVQEWYATVEAAWAGYDGVATAAYGTYTAAIAAANAAYDRDAADAAAECSDATLAASREYEAAVERVTAAAVGRWRAAEESAWQTCESRSREAVAVYDAVVASANVAYDQEATRAAQRLSHDADAAEEEALAAVTAAASRWVGEAAAAREACEVAVAAADAAWAMTEAAAWSAYEAAVRGADAHRIEAVAADGPGAIPAGVFAAFSRAGGGSAAEEVRRGELSRGGPAPEDVVPPGTAAAKREPSGQGGSGVLTLSTTTGAVYSPGLPPLGVRPPRWTQADSEAALWADRAYTQPGTGMLAGLGVGYDPSDPRNEFTSTGLSALLARSPVTNNLYLAFCGTAVTDRRDVRADIVQGLGGRTAQYDKAIELATRVRDKLGPDVKLILVGHSLGGGLAAAAAFATGLDAIGFNPPSLNGAYAQGTPGVIRSHIIAGDVLSVGRIMCGRTAPGEIIVHPPATLLPGPQHAMWNFPAR